MTYICISKLTIIGSDNGLLPGQHQASIWTNVRILLTGPLVTNFSEISIRIQTFSFKKMHLKMWSAKCHPFCLGLNVLTFLVLRPEHSQRSRSAKIAADALVLSILMPSAAMVLTLEDKCVVFFLHEEHFQLIPSYCWVKLDYVYFDVSSK